MISITQPDQPNFIGQFLEQDWTQHVTELSFLQLLKTSKMNLQLTIQLPQRLDVVGRLDGGQILQFLHVVGYDQVFSAITIFQ
jgi:hypothetical protein